MSRRRFGVGTRLSNGAALSLHSPYADRLTDLASLDRLLALASLVLVRSGAGRAPDARRGRAATRRVAVGDHAAPAGMAVGGGRRDEPRSWPARSMR